MRRFTEPALLYNLALFLPLLFPSFPLTLTFSGGRRRAERTRRTFTSVLAGTSKFPVLRCERGEHFAATAFLRFAGQCIGDDRRTMAALRRRFRVLDNSDD